MRLAALAGCHGLVPLHSDRGNLIVTKKLPQFPRLHVNETANPQEAAAGPRGQHAAICNAFETATGWSFETPTSANAPAHKTAALRLQKQTADNEEAAPPIARAHAASLAAAISDLTAELDRAHETLRHREAELAAGVPVSAGNNEDEHLARRLQAVIQGGAQAIGCQAGGLYMLDAATTELKLRAAWHLPPDRLLQPARPLAEAFADLEALAGHAVALEDTSLLPHWQPPEPYAAALCVPVSSPTEPLGTLWFFCEHARDFTDEQTNLAEIIAGRIASDLQREVLLQECISSKQADRQLIHAMQWQHDHLPNIKPLLDDYELSGWTNGDERLASGFYDWFVPPDGSLALALGLCDGLMVESALSAAALQAMVRSHARHPHRIDQLLAGVNETIWHSSAGGHFASLFYARLALDSGRLECAAAGKMIALLIRANKIEVISSDQLLLGIEPESHTKTLRRTIRSGDVLLVFATDHAATDLCDLGNLLRRHQNASVDKLAEIMRAAIPDAEAALLLRRLPAATN